MRRPLLHRLPEAGSSGSACTAALGEHRVRSTIPHMTTTPRAPTDADLLDTVRSLVGPAVRNQLWLFPYDEDGVPLQLVVPIEGVPFTPDVVPRLAEAVLEICRSADAGSVGLLWSVPARGGSRPGRRRPSTGPLRRSAPACRSGRPSSPGTTT